MSDSTDRFGMQTYLTPEEAKEFHKLFMMWFMIHTGIALAAHLLVWIWRPWIG